MNALVCDCHRGVGGPSPPPHNDIGVGYRTAGEETNPSCELALVEWYREVGAGFGLPWEDGEPSSGDW